MELYSIECLNRFRGGFKVLSCFFKVIEYNFNNLGSLYKNRSMSFEIVVICDGYVDVIVVWFDLRLDEEIIFFIGFNDDFFCWE